MKMKIQSCTDIQRTIVLGKIDYLNQADLKQLRAHLEHCPKCAGYSETLELVESILQQEWEPEKNELRSVRKQLYSAFEKNLQSGRNHRFFYWVLERLTWRVPVYQVAVGMILMFIVTFTAVKHSDSQEGISLERKIIAGMANLDTIQLEQLDNIGRSSLEDSTLISITVTSM